jgi:hypothetical protein
MMNQVNRGTVYAAFNDTKTTFALALNDSSQVVHLEYQAPAKLDINHHLLAIASALAHCLPTAREIILFEDEPRSREAADYQSFQKRSIATLAHACGLQLRAVHSECIEGLLMGTLPIDAPESAYEIGSVNALKLAAWHRTARDNVIPFGNVVRRSDLRRARSMRKFDEMVGGAHRGRWAWHGFEALRDDAIARNVPVWMKAEGIA